MLPGRETCLLQAVRVVRTSVSSKAKVERFHNGTLQMLVALYEEAEKPNNALDFLKQHLGVAGQESADTVALQQELRDMRQRWELLAEENKGLKNRLQRYEPTQEDGAAE
uniref:MYC binding protein n=1 Tax=Hucho hucho TaxID=62062 RepID=A0A4W5MQE2_9TELE